MVNWKVRFKNKHFWVTLIPAVLILIQTVASLFGATLDLGDVGSKLIGIVDAIFVILAILGIIVDPTTDGLRDSVQAMGYNVPKKSR